MKIAHLFFVAIASLLIASCNYSPASLPDNVRTEYELALPLMNDTLNPYADFNSSEFPDWSNLVTLPAGTVIELSENKKLPFFLNDFSTDKQEIEWVEPRFIIEDNLPSGTLIFLDCYVESSVGERNYFLVPANYSITSGTTNIVPKDPKRLDKTALDEIAHSEWVFVGVKMVFTKEVKITDLKKMELRVRFAMRFKVAVSS